MDALPQHSDALLMPRGGCAPVERAGSPDPTAPPAPRAALAVDAPAACSDISDHQLLAVTDTASLTADQLDRRHHLLRHSLPDEARGEGVLVHFEAASVAEAVKLIKKMSQRDLQAKFRLVYGAKTFSNNNNWLRRKLFEAIGVDPAKGAVKKAAAGGGGRRRRGGAAAARGGARAKAPRAKKAAAAADVAWYPAGHAYAAWQDDAAYGGAYDDAYGYGYAEEAAEVEMGEEDEGACEALLALGDAAASLEESFSEASAPSVSVAPVEPTPASTATTTDGAAKEEAPAAGGSAAFRRLLLEQHEAAAQAAAAAAAAAAASQAPPSALAEWMALAQHHAAAAAAAGMLPPHMLGGWPPVAVAHPAFIGALRHLLGAQAAPAATAFYAGK